MPLSEVYDTHATTLSLAKPPLVMFLLCFAFFFSSGGWVNNTLRAQHCSAYKMFSDRGSTLCPTMILTDRRGGLLNSGTG